MKVFALIDELVDVIPSPSICLTCAVVNRCVRSRPDKVAPRGGHPSYGKRSHMTAARGGMKFTLRTLLCFIASAAILLGVSTSIATKHPAPPVQSIQTTEIETQILLDRADFSPGEIDGNGGENSRKALAAFQAARGLAPGARSRNALLKALGEGALNPIISSYTITSEDAAGPFTKTIPEGMIEKSILPGLYYTSVLQALSEKFHSAPALLKRLNPGAFFTAGEPIQVPNVLGTKQEALDSARARAGMVKVVVSKKTSSLTVYDRKGRIIFYAPVTSGSDHVPLPIGSWEITEVRRNPIYNYNPELFWDENPAGAKAQIAAGPNNPVGVVWIGINDPHYGIHGTPEPGRIGYSQSDGCVRLTNWDASRLAGLVTKGTRVVFKE
jgi:lipoprotein-anchoring transpeptidase ErfK/SrfK